MLDSVKRTLKLHEVEFFEDVEFKSLTTIKCGGIASMVVLPKTLNEYIFVLRHLAEQKVPFKVVGNMSNVLPPRAEAPFDGTGLELRDTFTVDGMVYAKTGFGKVQLVDVGSRRSVTVAESVTYEGITYTVASIGLINSEGVYMKGRLLPLFASSVYIPKTVSYIWDNALSGLLVSITVDPENPWYVSENGNVKPKS
jgi:hypothetical protein